MKQKSLPVCVCVCVSTTHALARFARNVSVTNCLHDFGLGVWICVCSKWLEYTWIQLDANKSEWHPFRVGRKRLVPSADAKDISIYSLALFKPPRGNSSRETSFSIFNEIEKQWPYSFTSRMNMHSHLYRSQVVGTVRLRATLLCREFSHSFMLKPIMALPSRVQQYPSWKMIETFWVHAITFITLKCVNDIRQIVWFSENPRFASKSSARDSNMCVSISIFNRHVCIIFWVNIESLCAHW